MINAAAQLTIRLLGTPEIQIAGAPSPETQALFHEILRAQPNTTSLPKTAPRLSVGLPQALPLVGRDNLMNKLLAISQDAQSGRGATVLLSGEDGIGKSRLVYFSL